MVRTIITTVLAVLFPATAAAAQQCQPEIRGTLGVNATGGVETWRWGGTDCALFVGPDRFRIASLSNPASPTLVGSVAVPNAYGGGIDWASTDFGPFAFVASGTGLVSIGLTDPAYPTIWDSENLGGYARDVAVRGLTAYVANGYGGVQLVWVQNPGYLQPLGSVGYPAIANGIAIFGNFAFVTGDWNGHGFYVVDISDLSHPFVTASVPTFGCLDVAVLGNYAYVANGYSGLQVIDVSDPTNPFIAGTGNSGSGANSVAISTGRAWLASGHSGFHVFNVVNPAKPELLGWVDTPAIASGVVHTLIQTGAYTYAPYAIVSDNYTLEVIDVGRCDSWRPAR